MVRQGLINGLRHVSRAGRALWHGMVVAQEARYGPAPKTKRGLQAETAAGLIIAGGAVGILSLTCARPEMVADQQIYLGSNIKRRRLDNPSESGAGDHVSST